MLIPLGTTSLSLPNPSLNLSSVGVLNPSSLQTHLPFPRLSISTADHSRNQWTIRMGGGPRTFPGGVSKWQWKRMQAKKAKQLLKARLTRERQLYEMRKRAELQAAVSDLERPWETVSRAPALFSVKADEQVKVLADRFQRPGGYDLWSDRDGPQIFSSPVDGLPTARFFPKGVVHSIRPYGRRISENSDYGKEQTRSQSPLNSASEAGIGDSSHSTESWRNGGMRSRRSRRRRGGGELQGEIGDPLPSSYSSIDDVRQVHELGDLDSNSRANNGVKERRGLYDRRASAGSNPERESDRQVGVRGNYSKRGYSGSRGGKYWNRQRHHGSENFYGSDSEKVPFDGGESGRNSSAGRGRYNGSNRRFGAKRFDNLSQSNESRRIPFVGDGKFKSGRHLLKAGNSENLYGSDLE
ncbi:hypothetical protein MRB53_011854 [Persea americana]|uniref:Uncharacterized protein n=1 Tax=Persea americana TaxID=3435 RepID=A0ACC2LVQ6_PERAE|nr:hypothetical protein MRB53_011854 [Persea americana]|eukprot:TRINITY_DN47161_c0_g2_i1.p1 TRINITY_DN47161_c0_g2~~TRINITY_DN47161_c0_g2_i1.p1  ORF type:complete len:411 (-),score=87.79 TRINITY_DN47161_c0_g2_i1:310-1542(-)